ncbi:MAG: glycosyltransferase, partial [Candidatus Eremiobacteraeota bacterium]|nr:glycosyltransferase [Candidatus Eremiobacteraeota bacterium]
SCDAFLCVVSARNSPLTDEFSRAYRLHNVGEELFSCVNEFSPPPQTSRPLIFSFGFLRPEKGFEVLIEAFLQYRKTGGAGRLVIAGVPLTDDDRRYARMLRALAGGHDSIEFVEAYLEKDDVDRYLRSCSVFVLPYLSAVGNSAPLHSALGFGRPVIATAIPRNLPLRNAVTLVPPASSNALANALGRLFNVPGALDESAARARSAAMERGADALASEQYDLYRHLLDTSADHRLKHRVE